MTTDIMYYDMVITDPPYSDNVNYAELADFFYVWLRLVLAKENPAFAPDYTPKEREIIKNRARGLSDEDFRRGLQAVFELACSKISPDGLLVFTFHHSAGSAWESLLQALCDGGWEVEGIYPIHAESEVSLHLMDKGGAISYDLIHVCRRRKERSAEETRSWAGIRQEVRRQARREIEVIEAGRYGSEPLAPSDVNIILIGKCLELYSRYYGLVVDHEGRTVRLLEALETIRMEVDQLVSQEQPLPSELADIDPVSYVYLVCLADRLAEIKSDELHKYTRGVLEPDELIEAGLIIKGRTGRGRYFKIKSPAERFADLQEKLRFDSGHVQGALPGMEDIVHVEGSRERGICFIDYVHFLIALSEGGENLRPWLERFRRLTPQIRAACDYLRKRQPRFATTCEKILRFLEVSPLFKGVPAP